jgi:hypothetical protein
MPMTHDDLVAMLGADNVVRADPDVLRGIDLPPAARAVLSEIGLPLAVGSYTTTEPRLLEVAGTAAGYCIVGRATVQNFAVDLASGEVRRMRAADPGAYDWFVNSNLESFAACMAAYAVIMRDLPDERDDEESMRWGRRLEDFVRSVDPRSLDVEASYYAGKIWEISGNMI